MFHDPNDTTVDDVDPLDTIHDSEPDELTDARADDFDAWARQYDDLNGAPEHPYDTSTTRAFPLPPTRSADSTAYVYGCQILAYLLAADVYVYGLLSDEDLESALHASGYIVTAPDILPKAVDNLSEIRHAILETLQCRRDERAIVDVTPIRQSEPQTPNIGPMARLTPAPITRPPSTSARKVEVQF